MKAGTKSNKVGKFSPVGDLSKKDNSEYSKFFGRKIKNAGAPMHASSYLKVRTARQEGGNEAKLA